MIRIEEFEGIRGFRWGAFCKPDGTVEFSENTPEDALKKVGIIGKILNQAPFELSTADFIFGLAKVLVRKGSSGLYLLFCEDDIKVSMVEVVLAENSDHSTDPGSGNSSINHTDSNFSFIQSFSTKSDKIPTAVIEELLALYIRFLGPLARVFAEKECKNAGFSLENLTVKDWSALLNLLGARIPNDVKREDFLSQAVLLKTKF